jgi:hypothetical protein
MIARQFTLGQLALIAWQLHEFSEQALKDTDVIGRNLDLRRMSSAELSRHLSQLGA